MTLLMLRLCQLGTLRMLSIIVTVLTATAVLVSVVMMVNFFASSESWEVDNNADIGVVCFFVFDLVAHMAHGLCGIFCMMDINI